MGDSDQGSGDEKSQPLAVGRSRRQKNDKHGRFAALQRLKQLKNSGSKNKYEVTEVDNVYEEVDERDYAERVLKRQEDNFIVDDDGAGYVEDGREIFDDDLYVSEEKSKHKKNSLSSNKTRRRPGSDDEDGENSSAVKRRKAGGDIRKMIGNISHIQSHKKKSTEVKKLDDDQDLQKILKELEASPLETSNTTSTVTSSALLNRQSAREYLKSFSTPAPKQMTPNRSIKMTSFQSQSSFSHVNHDHQTNKPSAITPKVVDKDGTGKGILREKEESVVKIKEEPLDMDDDSFFNGLDDSQSYHDNDVANGVTQNSDKAEPNVIVDKTPATTKMEIDTNNVMDCDENLLNGDFFTEEFDCENFKPDLKKDDNDKSGIEDNAQIVEDLLSSIKDENIDDWDNVMKGSSSNGSSNNGAAAVSSSMDPTKLPLVEHETHGKLLYFYYLDAHEEYFQQPGVVYLFGKVWDDTTNAFHSCCVTVKDIDRNVYLLPREHHMNLISGEPNTEKPVSMQDVYEEFDKKVSTTYQILKYKCRTVTKSYAFNITDVPLSSEYLQVKYSAKYPKLPHDLRGETFSHVFGVNSSFLELLLLDRKIKGPRWLAIKNPDPVTNHFSWCRMEVNCKGDDLLTGDQLSELNDKQTPPLTVLTLSSRILYNKRTTNNEIIAICGLVHNKFPLVGVAPKPPFQQHFCAMTKVSDRPWPLNLKAELSKNNSVTSIQLEKCESERALLNYFMARLCRIDPDLIVCHDFVDFELGVLLKKLTDHRIPNWSRLGRLKRANRLQGKAHVLRNALCGRLVCDMKICAKELIRARSYDLDTLCTEVLKMKEGARDSFTQDELIEMLTDSGRLIRLMKSTVLDATYILRLMVDLNVLPLALQITNIAGNVMSRTLMGGRSERNEFLLLHAFSDKGFIVPEKDYKNSNKIKEENLDLDEDDGNERAAGERGDNQNNKRGGTSRAGRRKPAYAGGLVLEPKKGLYDRLVLLMDFNSLYPSIIQEYNICFTTIDRTNITQNLDVHNHYTRNRIDYYVANHNTKLFEQKPAYAEDISSITLPKDTSNSQENGTTTGILPSEIRHLVESRRVVKNMIKNSNNLSSELKLQYEIRQLALKLMANSMYGCLGFANSRFCCKPLAALVTAKGREILLKTKDLVEKMGYEVVYGDTDSLMINTNSMDYAAVKKIGHKIKSEVNRCYKQLELDIDGIFRCLLLCKKKKYAASVIVNQLPDGSFQLKQEIKGLDIVRRDWCQLSSEAGKFILAQILSDQDTDERVENIHKHLRQLRSDLEEAKVPLTLLTIAKQLAKAPEEYADKKSQPHVSVGLRANSKSGQKRFKAGDTVHYVICLDGTNNSSTQRAYLIEEMKTNPELKVDVNYYLEQQVLPVVSRICEPIDGTEPARIAESLGLDYKHYEKTAAAMYQDQDNLDNKMLQLSSKQADKFNNCEKFSFKCVKCGAENIVEGPTRKLENGVEVLVLNRCVNTECEVQPIQYINSIKNSLTITIRSFIKKYYQGWLKCEDPYCMNRKRRVAMKRKQGMPLCDSCLKHNSHNVMKVEYTDYELYNQLTYFRSIFDSSKVPSSVRIDSELISAYATLHQQVANFLSYSAYATVNLTQLFFLLTPFATKKSEKSIS